MPPRLPFLSAIRQWQAPRLQTAAKLSTTTQVSALKDPSTRTSNTTTSSSSPDAIPSYNSPAASLLGLGDEPPDPTDTLHRLYRESEGRRMERARQKHSSTLQRIQQSAVAQAYLQQMPRPWRQGDVYAPRDLGPGEMVKWRGGQRRQRADVVDLLGINPLERYKNFTMISEHITSMGFIKHSKFTGLRPTNQRKMAKAIRRAIGMGLHPSIHKHPELLRPGERYAGRQMRLSGL